jgi:hypothetical protein
MVNKQISVKPNINEQLKRLRIKYADDEGKPSSYGNIIKKALKKAKMWAHDYSK